MAVSDFLAGLELCLSGLINPSFIYVSLRLDQFYRDRVAINRSLLWFEVVSDVRAEAGGVVFGDGLFVVGAGAPIERWADGSHDAGHHLCRGVHCPGDRDGPPGDALWGAGAIRKKGGDP